MDFVVIGECLVVVSLAMGFGICTFIRIAANFHRGL